MLTKNALANMQNRYNAVLKKCRLLDVFGSLAMVTVLSLGVVGDAWAADLTVDSNMTFSGPVTFGNVTASKQLTISSAGTITVNGLTKIKNGGAIAVENGGKYNATGQIIELPDNGGFTVTGATVITGDATAPTTSYGLVAKTLSASDFGKYTATGTTLVEGRGSICLDGTMNDYGIAGQQVNYGSYDANGETTVRGTNDSNKGIITVSNYGHYNAFDQTITVNTYGEISVEGKTVIAEGNNPTPPYSLAAETLNISGGTYNVGAATSDWIATAITNSGLQNSTQLGVLGIAQANMLSVTNTGTLNVGNPSSTADINFGASSLLVVSASACNSDTNYALNADAISVDAGAKLLISNVQLTDGKATVHIAKADADELALANGAWGYDGANEDGTIMDINPTSTDSLYFDDAFTIPVGYIYDKATGTYSVTLGIQGASGVLAGTGVDSTTLEYIDKAKANNTLSTFFGDASKIRDPKKAATTMEGAMKTTIAAGVLNSTHSVSNLAALNANNRVSFSQATSLGSVVDHASKDVLLADNGTVSDAQNPVISGVAKGGDLTGGLAIWMQPMYQSVNADGFASGSYEYGYDTDIYGASFGTDYTVDNSIRYGLALHVGGGHSASSKSDFCHTENDFDYFGATLYAGYVGQAFSLSADMGYTVTRNELSQETSVGDLSTNDFDTAVFSLGTRAEYKFATDFVDIIPYLGARVNYFETESFDVKASTETAYHNLASFATTFAVPMGVTFSKSMRMNDFELIPHASLGVQFTMGDLDLAQKVSGSGTLESEVFDPATFMGSLGLDATFDNITLGLEYKLGASENVTSHQVMTTAQYRF